jgi:hypothetical protein
MKKEIFKATIAGQTISMYRRKNGIDKDAFDSIMNEHKANGRSPGKELIARLKAITDCTSESWLLGYLKAKAVANFGDWPGNLQEVIWCIIRDATIYSVCNPKAHKM